MEAQELFEGQKTMHLRTNLPVCSDHLQEIIRAVVKIRCLQDGAVFSQGKVWAELLDHKSRSPMKVLPRALLWPAFGLRLGKIICSTISTVLEWLRAPDDRSAMKKKKWQQSIFSVTQNCSGCKIGTIGHIGSLQVRESLTYFVLMPRQVA